MSEGIVCGPCGGRGFMFDYVEQGSAMVAMPGEKCERCEGSGSDIRAMASDLLDAGYDNGFGVTSLDTLLCEQMDRAERLDFAAFILREALAQANGTPQAVALEGKEP